MPVHITRTPGTVLSAAIYNGDFLAGEAAITAVTNAPRVQGLRGINNASFPTTRLDLAADWILLKHATGTDLPVLRSQPTALTCNLSTAGPVANGRDQAAAFTGSTYVYAYFIWNGATLATLASAVPPPTGPTLPTGYTHWAFATARRLSSIAALLVAYDRGSWVWYQARQEVVTAGSATSPSSVACGSVVPPIALEIELEIVANVGTNAGGSAHSDVFVGLVPSVFLLQGSGTPANASDFDQDTRSGRVPNVNTTVIYQWVDAAGTANINNRDVWIRVLGYSVPNGG